MPKYTYKCKKCEIVYDMVHSMSLKETICRECGEEPLTRVSSVLFSVDYKKQHEKKTGTLVKEFISETKEAIEEEKKEMQKDFEC